MLVIIISLLITIATFYVMAYLYKIDHNPPKVTIGDVLDEYSFLVVGIIIPFVNEKRLLNDTNKGDNS